jgi:hypothetical protein
MSEARNAISQMDLKSGIELDALACLYIALSECVYIVEECFVRQCRRDCGFNVIV